MDSEQPVTNPPAGDDEQAGDFAEAVNMADAKVENVQAEYVRLHESAVRHISATEVELRQSIAQEIQADDVRIQQGIGGIIQAGEIRMTDSVAGIARATEVSLNNCTGGFIQAGNLSMSGGRAAVVVAKQYDCPETNTTILLASHVNGNVTTILDTPRALLAGLAAGSAMGLVFLLGSLLRRRR